MLSIWHYCLLGFYHSIAHTIHMLLFQTFPLPDGYSYDDCIFVSDGEEEVTVQVHAYIVVMCTL